MTFLNRLGMTLFATAMLALALAAPVEARVASIQTTATLADHSDGSVRAAIEDAVRTAIRGALAMGFTRVRLHQAHVLDDLVVIQLLATDSEDVGEHPAHPTAQPEGAGARRGPEWPL